MPVPQAAQRIEREIASWAGTSATRHHAGGREYCFGRRVIARVHGDDLVEIALPKHVRDEVIAAGLATANHDLPEGGWVRKSLHEEPDVEIALALVRRAYGLARDRAGEGEDAGGDARLDKVDEAGRESFPASDPPS